MKPYLDIGKAKIDTAGIAIRISIPNNMVHFCVDAVYEALR